MQLTQTEVFEKVPCNKRWRRAWKACRKFLQTRLGLELGEEASRVLKKLHHKGWRQGVLAVKEWKDGRTHLPSGLLPVEQQVWSLGEEAGYRASMFHLRHCGGKRKHLV